jgi:hypothetical protein
MKIRNEDRDEWVGVAGSGGRGEEHRLAADKGIPSACVCGGQCAREVAAPQWEGGVTWICDETKEEEERRCYEEEGKN